jgi:formylglycine-generating enzyme
VWVLFDKELTTLVQFPRGLSGSYTIPDSVTRIGEYAFSGCTGLTNVVIPGSVTTIGEYAFSGCTGLQEVYFQGNAPTAPDNVFSGGPGTLYDLYGATGFGNTFGGWPTALLVGDRDSDDRDSDGLPDWWEVTHFASIFGSAPTDDFDNDLFNNISEWIAGTDPSDSNSVFVVSVPTNQGPTGFVIEWTAVEDRTYSVEWRRTLTNDYELLQHGIEYPQNSYTDTLHNAESTGFYQIMVNNPPKGMVWIPGGTNSGRDPTYSLTVSSFYMDRTEVTKAQWDVVYTWAVKNGYGFDHAGSGKASDHPVQTVNWYDCVKWCNARSEMEGRTPCYTVNGSPYKTGRSAPVCNFEANGYRLPTEAEWEKAARGGLQGKRFPWGDTITHGEANYISSSSYTYDISATRSYHPAYDYGGYPYTSPVGSFPANGYGLYDMTGNVWEWCWDWNGEDYYASSPSSNPQGPSSGSKRVPRGGSWSHIALSNRSADRNGGVPTSWYNDLGFRVCISAR